jgi:dihydrofolate reductase
VSDRGRGVRSRGERPPTRAPHRTQGEHHDRCRHLRRLSSLDGHFLNATPSEALEQAREAADGADVRIGGGPTVVRDFLAAGLVDHMHVAQVPIVLGRGVRLWDGLESLEETYDIEAVSTPSGVTHLTFTAKRR